MYFLDNRQEAVNAVGSSSSIQMTSLLSHKPSTSSHFETSETSFTAAHWFTAVAHNDLRAVSYFLSRGADVNTRFPVTYAIFCSLKHDFYF